ncbi:MAG: Hpt domain-containing protein [Fusobacteriaceae bacterium]|mgnify:FL=1|nr:Hpt domain-containing protein [Fusobacteriaceae bacterium]MBP9596197.1 Hpt domain-containing protein [Fusobacteriaceae bacterium]MBU9918380.1 Hpt domain-containing protein [Fusobacteriaceae bacterium]
MDIDKSEFIDDFIEDMNDLMANAETSLKKLEESHSSDLINELFRVAHSIKGMSASMEFKRLEMLTHKIEDLMYVVRDNTLEFNQEILEILQIGFAFLNELFVSVKLSGVEDDAPCEGMEVLIKKIKDILESKNEPPKEMESIKVEQRKIEETKKLKSIEKLAKINVILDKKCSFKTVRAFMILNRLNSYGEFLRTIPNEKNINSKDYEMKNNILSIFLELNESDFEKVKSEIMEIMEINSVNVEYVKNIEDNKVVDYCDDVEFSNEDIINEISKIELNIVKMEYSENLPIELVNIKDDLNKLNKMVLLVEVEEIVLLFNKILELVNVVSKKDLRNDDIIIEILLDSFIILKDTLSNQDEESIEKDIKNIKKYIETIGVIIENEKSNTKQALGSILMSQGVLKNDDVEDILKLQQEQPNKKFGEIAIEENKVSSKEIVSALKIQNKKAEDRKDEAVELLKVPVTKADHLIDLLEELMMVQSQLEKSVLSDFSKDSLTVKTMMTSFRITKEIQNLSISFRMVTLRNIFQKVNITVRDSLKKLEKKAEILIYGEDTEIDRVVGNRIIDPLLHLVKNSVAHGIESKEERKAAGKRESGIISISARAEKGYVYIEITDDGQGINTNKIFSTAVKKGLINENDKMSEEDIVNLIFAPGFSTAEAVDTISGRGVGMDVVKTEISKLGGRIIIHNRAGQGITFTLRIPQNMTSLNGTVVNIMDKKYIIPTVYIKEVFSINEDTYVSVVGKNQYVKLRKNIVPIIPTENYFTGEENSKIMIVLEVDGVQKALPVNQVMERREIVVKPLSEDFDAIKYISGASILGDGQAALIIGVEQLFKLR